MTFQETHQSAPASDASKKRYVAFGAIAGAIGASACCILPLVLFSMGITGAWMANLTAMTPYKPYFIAATMGFLAYGYWLVYRPQPCEAGETCARPLPNRLVKSALWLSTALVLMAFFWKWIAPVLAPLMLGL